jgi:hypothetical protein
MSPSTSVPHHRVNAAVHAAAREHARLGGLSLSAVATAGLNAYVTRSTPGQVVAGPDVPADVAGHLRQLHTGGDPRFVPYLTALHGAGWSYAALARAVGLTRQAIHLRLAKAGPGTDVAGVGLPVPGGPRRTRSSDRDRFDWAVWVDPQLYRRAVAVAASAAEPMHQVMEQILADFLSGHLAVLAGPNRNATTTKEHSS